MEAPDPYVVDALTRGNPVVFLDITFKGSPIDKPIRLKLELFKNSCPKTVENFRQLCTGEHLVGNRPMGYKGSNFHRVIKGFMIQGGDFLNGDGTGSFSIYGTTFDDEPFRLRHDDAGLLSMANSGPNTNGCQFFITTNRAPHLDGKHVVFGRVLGNGMGVVRRIENAYVDGNGKPKYEIAIVECGEL